MTSITFCPHFLMPSQHKDPLEIEENYIYPLSEMIDEAFKRNIPIYISEEIANLFQTNYPWDLLSDPKWKGFISTWHSLLTSKISKFCELRGAGPTMSKMIDGCPLLAEDIIKAKSDFLENYGSHGMPNRDHEEGVFIDQQCGTPATYKKYYLFRAPEDLEKIKYPWLRIYNKPLPPEGELPFIPPVDWRLSPIPKRGLGQGYIDSAGREWQWDKLHENHWDVQENKGYKNVSPDGRIL